MSEPIRPVYCAYCLFPFVIGGLPQTPITQQNNRVETSSCETCADNRRTRLLVPQYHVGTGLPLTDAQKDHHAAIQQFWKQFVEAEPYPEEQPVERNEDGRVS